MIIIKSIIIIINTIIFPIYRIYWRIFKPIRNGVRIVIFCNNNILTVKHTYGWKNIQLPGGIIKNKEKPIDTAKREINEELGIEINNILYKGNISYSSKYGSDNIYVYKVNIDNIVKTKINPNYEIKDIIWININTYKKNKLSATVIDIINICIDR